MRYKVVKIWFVDASDTDTAIKQANKVEPVFVSANDRYTVSEEQMRNRGSR